MFFAKPSRLGTVLLLLTKGVVEAEEEECCPKKVVGSISYTLVPAGTFRGELPQQCINACVYTVSGTSSPKFCFKKGNLPTECSSDVPGSDYSSSKLENDDMCGITTGGKAECWWDCEILSHPLFTGQAIINPECLKDCFDQEMETSNRDPSCLKSLIEDVTAKGTCELDDDSSAVPLQNPAPIFAAQGINVWGWNELENNCTLDVVAYDGGDYSGDYEYDYKRDGVRDEYEISYGGDFTVLTKGTCSDTTEALFRTPACHNSLAEQPNIIRHTLRLLLQFSCSEDLFHSLPSLYGRKQSPKKGARLAPVSMVDVTAGTKTELNYNNTRHRYPWICSLRTLGINSDHICAVNLLAVPPKPTVIVGSAHCTYLCKNLEENGVTLPSCCCVNRGQESCQDDTVKCGTRPVAVEMDGSDAEIICGEWQTGSMSQSVSEEEYNVVLPILEIIRSPAFDATNLGPGGGADIAVFKVNDENLQNPRSRKIYPACLPPRDRSTPTSGVHSGWTKPPPLSFLEKFGSGFVPYYDDFFKQWHYSMAIQERCEDPTFAQAFGVPVEFPSETYYPPATVCAKDVTSQSCFSTGDSGSPLMVREERRPDRFFIEGILSFVKGCEQFSFGISPLSADQTRFQLVQNSENPAAYTKLSCFLPWIAEQYGLSYEPEFDESCNEGTGPEPPFNSTHPYNAICRQNKGTDLSGKEHPCIFPFYYRGKGPYNECTLFEEEDFVYPVFRCPVRNITTKFPGTDINHFEESLELTDGYCFDMEAALAACNSTSPGDCNFRLLNPALECFSAFKFHPFSSCKNDCPGVRSFGIIGGGAVLADTGIN